MSFQLGDFIVDKIYYDKECTQEVGIVSPEEMNISSIELAGGRRDIPRVNYTPYRNINFEAAMKVIYDHNLYPEFIEALNNIEPDYKSKVD